MRALALALVKSYTQWNLPVKDKEVFCALLLSRAIAFNLQLPSSPVESPLNYYNDNYVDLVNDLLTEVNDSQIIPFEATKKLIIKLWVYRYQMVYLPLSQAFDLINIVSQEDVGFDSKAIKDFFEVYSKLRYSVSTVWIDAANLVNAELNGRHGE